MTPELSIVIPTVNRRESLQRLLRSLASDRTAPPFEVIVVDDGSTDGTLESLETVDLPFRLRVLAQQAAGPSRARNRGAQIAEAPVLIFFDDDVEPLPGTLARHAAFHAHRSHVLGIGDLPPVTNDTTMFGVVLRGWWDQMLDECRRPGHRFTFRNVLTGHLSVRREAFAALGGFDVELRCHEDWEFGFRALQAGMRIEFVAGAIARHHESSDLAKVFRRKFEEGAADVQLARRHRDLVPALPLFWPHTSRKEHLMAWLAWRPAVAWIVKRQLTTDMRIAHLLRLRGRWRATLNLLLVHEYWRGVASALPDRAAVRALIGDAAVPRDPEIVIDLAAGLDAAENRLDAINPASATLMYGDAQIATMRAWAGAEPLRGAHLRPFLAMRDHRAKLQRAMAAAGTLLGNTAFSARSDDASGSSAGVNTPVVRQVELPVDVLPPIDAQRGAAVPPVHHVA